MSIYNYITIVTAALIIILILLQTRGASLGAGLGGSGEINIERRGSDKTIHQITIFLVFLFTASLILHITA